MSGSRMSRRGFLRTVSASAAGLAAGWSAVPSFALPARIRQSAGSARIGDGLIDEEGFRKLCEALLDAATGDHTFIALTDTALATTSLRDGGDTQSTARRGISLAITTAFGNRHATVEIHELGQDAALQALRGAEQAAEAAAEDAAYMPPLGPQRYPILPTYRPETDLADEHRRVREAVAIGRLCSEGGVAVRQGLVTASVTARGAAANSGLLAFDRETAAGFQFIAFRRDNNEAAGLSSGQSRSIDDLDAAGAARDAVERLRYLAKPLDFKDGRCTVILAPAAVAGLLAPLIASMESPPSRGSLGGRLGEVVVDRRLRLQNRPDHPDLLGRRFDDRGAPADFRSWIADGALRGTSVDSAAASEGEGETAAPDTDGQAAATATLQYPLDAAHFSASETTADSLEALIGATQHGILVSAVEHVRASGGAELPVSGRASAAFLIEEGGIVGGISAPAFRDGVLRAFNAIDAVTPAAGAVGPNGKVLAPAMRIRDFAFRA